MINPSEHPFTSVRSFDNYLQFTIKWVPRTMIAGLAGYYCLGLAYKTELMLTIDRIAIRILHPRMGLMGVGAFMPTFQWYSAWCVRFTAAIVAGILYDLTEKICRMTFRAIFPKTQVQKQQTKETDQTNQTGRKSLPI